ncbi:MAG: hypothetical protein RIT22_2138 [Bacteroidota bacterium]
MAQRSQQLEMGWGCIYYNKEDQRILPPKRIPWMGWTINFANSKSVVLFVAILVFCLLSVLYSESLI